MYKKKALSISEDDIMLWSNFRAGDAVAYTNLMRLYTNTMFRYGSRLSTDGALVKDCIQDVFLELWNRRGRINQTPSVKAYLLKALRLRIYREQPKWNYAECLNDDYHFTIEYNIETQIIAEQSVKEDNEKLEKILNSLPHRQKEILYLRFYENLDQARIAEVMGLNRQSVYNLLNESLNTLRKYWFRDLVTSLAVIFASLQ